MNNSDGFNKYGINIETGSKYDKRGFDKNGEHQTGSLWDTNGLDVNGNYNPIFDGRKKQKRDDLCSKCDGLGEITRRSSHHQFSEDQNYKIICPDCIGTGKKKIEK